MRNNTSFLAALGGLVLLVVLVVGWKATAYIVDEREFAVVLLFGKPVAEHTEPGLYFTTPAHEVRTLRGVYQFWQGEHMPDLPTKEADKRIELVPWAIWKISDPTLFVEKLRTNENAEMRVRQIVRSAIREIVSEYDLKEFVRSTDRELPVTGFRLETSMTANDESSLESLEDRPVKIQVGRVKILQIFKEKAKAELAKEPRGIEIFDVGVTRIELSDFAKKASFNRQIAKMESEAEGYLAEGEKRKQQILNDANRQVETLQGEGEEQSREIRGKVEADIIRMYAETIEELGEFYTFMRTLEAYKKAFSTDTRLILTTNSDFLRLLKNDEPLTIPSAAIPPAANEPVTSPTAAIPPTAPE
ncbi:MAG: protease modulator HflC, partial [Planctomycetales bacterium]